MHRTLSVLIFAFSSLFTNLTFCSDDPIKLFTKTSDKISKIDQIEYSTLIVDQVVLSQIYNSKKQTIILEIPFLGNNYEVELYSYDLLSLDCKLMTNGDTEVQYDPGVYYRGVIKDIGGVVAFSFFEDDIIGLISTKKGKLLNIGKPLKGALNEYVVYNSNDVKSPPNITCQAEELPEYASQLESMYQTVASSSRMGDCVNIYIEGDFALHESKGGVTQAADYLTGLWNPVATLFDNESIEVNISEIFIWDTSDSYNTNAGVALDEFMALRPTYNGNLAHLVAFSANGSNLSGIAYVDVICSNNFGYGVSRINNGYNHLPSYSWAVNVLTHELGHNLGSPHTQWCGWPGGPIDGCVGSEANNGVSCSDGPIPTNGGTIMSYCNVNFSVGINFNNGFGTLPGDLIRSNVASASCLGNCTSIVVINPPTADFSYSVTETCASTPAEVEYTDDSTNNPTSWSWTFPGGSPSTSSSQNPTVNYSVAGTYSATLEVTNADGDDEVTMNNVITVESNPDVSFDLTINGNTISTDNMSQNASSYDWDFGDGSSSTSFEPNHTYSNGGSYTVTLTGQNNCGNDQYSMNITISSAPIAGFNVSNNNGCASLDVDYTSTSSNNTTSWQWSFPGGSPSSSSSPNPTVTYHNSGVYSATLIVSNGSSTDTETMSNIVVVQPSPTADYSYSANNSGQVSFDNDSDDATSYSWSFGDGSTSSSTNPNHTYTNGGSYTVSLIATNSCGSDTHTEIVQVSVLPNASFTTSNPDGCVTHNVQYSDMSTGASSYFWEFEGGNPSTSTQQNPSVSYSSSGNFDATLTVTNISGSDEYALNNVIQIEDEPDADFNYTVNGTTVDFQNQSNNGDSYIWSFGDGSGSSQTNPTHIYENGGSYSVSLTTSNNCGTNQTSSLVTITILPTASFTSNNTTGCATHTIEFTNTSSDGNSYLWEFEGGNPATSTVENPSVEYDTEGNYDVTLTVTNTFGSDEYTLNNAIQIEDAPDVDFTYTVDGTTVFFQNLSNNGDSYNWSYGDGNGSSDTSPSYTYSERGTYSVTLTASNNCGSNQTNSEVIISILPVASFTSSSTLGCARHTVNFTNTSSEGNSYLWEFEGGNPATSVVENPIVEYGTEGIYGVSLTVTNAFGTDQSNINNFIIVEDVPIVDFSHTNDAGTVTFTNMSTNSDTYIWLFGDGTNSNQISPTHTYGDPGSYTVTLVATNDCGQNQITSEIIAEILPEASFFNSTPSGCATHQVTFTDTSTGADAFFWEFEGGNPSTSTMQHPTVEFENEGIYSVSLTASNDYGSDLTTASNIYVIRSIPDIDFSYTVNGGEVTFTSTSDNADTYLWDFGDGNTSASQDPSHTYTDAGTYLVSLTATNICGDNTISYSVLSEVSPIASFTSSEGNGCVTHNISYVFDGANASTYDWAFPGGTPSVSNIPNPVIEYQNTGTYNVTLIVTNAFTSDNITKQKYVNVNDLPDTNFEYSVDVGVVSFTNLSENGTNPVWDFGDGNTSSASNPVYTYEEDGDYIVTLTTMNECGQSIHNEALTITFAPSIFINSDITEGCLPATFRFSNESINSESVQWEFPGGSPANSSDDNPIITYATPGIYDVTIIASNEGGTNQFIFGEYITVLEEPESSFISLGDGLDYDFTNTSVAGQTYLWDFGDGDTSTEYAPSHTYVEEGIYTVTLEVTNSCGVAISTIDLNTYTPPSGNITQNKTAACINENVRYRSNASDNTLSFEWEMIGASPSTSTVRNPLVQYTSGGTYTVSLTVTNPAGEETYTAENIVVISEEPIANFSQNNTGLTTAYNNDSENGETYLWDFGDGNTSNEENPEHTYPSEDFYTVSLTTTNICGSNTVTTEFNNYTTPESAFIQNKEVACTGENVRYRQQASNNTVSYMWNMPGATPEISTALNPLVKYSQPGQYDVSLTVSNPAGEHILVKPMTVEIIDVPQSDFSFMNNVLDITFLNQSNGADSYSWDLGDGTKSTAENPIHTYAEEGMYDVSLTSTNSCGSTTITQTLEVTSLPTANFTSGIGLGATSCVPSVIQYQSLSSSNVETLMWTFPGGNPETSTETNPKVTYDKVGTFSARLEVFNSSDNDVFTVEEAVTIIDEPIAEFNLDIDGVTIQASDASEGAEQITWFVDGVSVSTGTDLDYTPNENGQYEITQLVVNSCGESESMQVITLSNYPDTGFTSDNSQICLGGTITFQASFDSNESYQWAFEGGQPATSTIQSPTITYPEAGDFDVTLVVSNIGGDSTTILEDYITVLPTPTIESIFELIDDSTIQASVEQIDDVVFDWYVNGAFINNGTTLSFTMIETGTYLVELFINDNCGQILITEEFSYVRSSLESIQLSQMTITPNPTTDFISITMDNSQIINPSYYLNDYKGELIKSGEIHSQTELIDVKNLPDGIYILSVQLENNYRHEKIVVAH